MAYQPDQCWTLGRVPSSMECPAYLLQNAKEVVTFGRRQASNDKICNGPHVSRNHLKFVRSGSASDWQNVRWSVVDLGGMVGTYVNRTRIEANNPFGLNCGDLIGVGCPEICSVREGGKETFVYRLQSPRAFLAQVVQVEAALEDDAPTPPPSPGDRRGDSPVGSSNLPDVVRKGSAVRVAEQGDDDGRVEGEVQEGEAHGHHEVQVVQHPGGVALSIKQEPVKGDGGSPAVITLDSSDEGGSGDKSHTVEKSAEPNSPLVRKRRVRRLLSSSDDDDEATADIKRSAKIARLTPSVKLPKFRSVLCSLPSLCVPDRAVAAQLEPGQDKVMRWVVASPNQYKRMARIWAGLKEDGSEGSPLLVELAEWDDESDGRLSDVSSEEIPDGFGVGDLSPISSEDEMEVDTAQSNKQVKSSQKRSRNEEDEVLIDSPATQISKSLKNISKLRSSPILSTTGPHDPDSVRLKLGLKTVNTTVADTVAAAEPVHKLPSDMVAKWKSSFGGETKPTKNTSTSSIIEKCAFKGSNPHEVSGDHQRKEIEPLVKRENVEAEFNFSSHAMNYSQQEEVIEILDSSDEEDYEANQSQSILSSDKGGMEEDFSDVDELLRESPTSDKEDISESDLSDTPEDDDEIEILNESQNSLFATIFKAVHKVEPEMDIREETNLPESDESISQSLLDDPEGFDEDNELISDIVNAVEGADDNMVRSAIRKLKQGTNDEAPYDDIFELVKEECEDNLVKKLSRVYSCGIRQVKICLAELKGDDKDVHVTKEMLEEAVQLKQEEDELIKSIEIEFPYSKDKIKEVLKELKVTVDNVDKEKLVKKLRENEDFNECIASIAEKKGVSEYIARDAVMEIMKIKGKFEEKSVEDLIDEKMNFKEKIDSIKMDIGCSEELVRDVLTKCHGDAEAAACEVRVKLLTHQKSKNLAEIFNTSVDYAREKLEESGLDEAAASQAIEIDKQELEENTDQVKPKQLAEVFDISIEEAQELLIKSGNDLEKASQMIYDKMEESSPKDDLARDDHPRLIRSTSPVFEDNDSDFEELMKECNELENQEILQRGSSEERSPPYHKSAGVNKVHDTIVDEEDENVLDDVDDLLDDKEEKSDALTKDRYRAVTKTVDLGRNLTPSNRPAVATSRPSFSKQLSAPGSTSGPKLIDALAMPNRRAIHRGISVSTVDSLTNKKPDLTAKKPDFSSLKPVAKKHEGIISKPNKHSFFAKPEKPKFKSKEELAVERKQKLKEVAERNKRPEVDKPETAPAGKMKCSVPKNQKLLLEMQAEAKMGPPRRKLDQGNADRLKTGIGRERRTSESDSRNNEKPAKIENRRGSAGFLEEEATFDKKKKKEKYATTSDGYKAVKKMSIANVDYNVMSQDISKMPIKAKPLQFAGIKPKEVIPGKMKKKLRWRDQTGLEPLVDVKEIPADNKGMKCGSGNKDFHRIDLKGGNKKATGPKEMAMDDIFKTILEWKCVWLEEQKKSDEPPPVQGGWQLLPLTHTFSSGAEYTKIFLPLMLHELWSSVSGDYEEKLAGGREEIVPVCLQELCRDSTQQFNLVRCVGLLTEQEARRDLGVEGTLVQLNISFRLGGVTQSGKHAREIKPCFGYMQQVRKVVYRGAQELGELDRERVEMLEVAAQKNSRRGHLRHLVHYTVKTKLNLASPDKVLSLDKPIYMKVLSRIKPEMRKFQALLNLPQSKLHSILVSPTNKTFQLGLGSEFLHAMVKDVPQVVSLNKVQKKSVVSMARACLSEPEIPRVCLMQGPPGTGKSSTITGLILQILYSGMERGQRDNMPRILVVAPSNAAVDELVLKLVATKSSLPESIRFRLIRLGIEKAMKPEVQKYTFDSNVERIMTTDTRQMKAAQTLEQDQKTKQAAANQIFEEKIAAETAGNTDLATKLQRDWKEKMQQIEKIKAELKKPLDSKAQRELRRSAEDRTMAGADVILATLSSSLSREMDKYFVQGVGTVRSAGAMRPISVCIMDEASQCVEPEALIPLKLGFNKLVMVGDHEQLPATVTSMKAKELDYQQSLFGRLFSFLTGGGSNQMETASSAGNTPPMVSTKCPVLRLDTQYRMHQEIADWPARYFYGGLLTSGGQTRDSMMAPYTVMHVQGVAKVEGGNCWNKKEEKAIINIIQAIRELLGDKPSIGVITFYAKQRQNISLEVQNKKLSNIIVNTVDGFQGSERDIIIISCVRGGPGGIGFLKDRQRLNVALTRARFGLVVAGNMETLEGASPMWKELINNAKERKVFFNMEEEKMKEILVVNRKK